MAPLRVTFALAAPMVTPDRPIHLDGLLAWAKVDQRKHEGATPDDAVASQEALPLERHECSLKEWFWRASQLEITPEGPAFLRAGIRRTDIDAISFDRDAGIVDVRAKNVISLRTGPYRNYDYRFAVQWCSKAEAWCIGDADEIGALLGRLRGLGRMTRNGWGAIKGVSIDVVANEDCHWNRRALPRKAKTFATATHFESTGNIVAPYWDRATYRPILEYVAVPVVT